VTKIRRLVLDILKPHEPSLVDFAGKIEGSEGVDGVNAIVIEIDEEVQNVKLTLEGPQINFEDIKNEVESQGASVHSIDEIVCGQKLVEESKTPQD